MRVEVKKISKRFGGVLANRNIDLAFEPGRIYGLLGENGAGKSTLMKILSGYQSADSGRIVIDGKARSFASPSDALRAGVGMLYQEPLDLPPFTVLENFLLGRAGRMRIDSRQAGKELLGLSKRYRFVVQPDEYIRNLSLGERQQLELLRLLSGGAQLLILDEPTTGISAEQKKLLFASMRELATKERKTLILVSHKLDEVQDLCDEVFVLRQGRLVGKAKLPTPNSKLVKLMFEQAPPARRRPKSPAGKLALELKGAAVHTPRLNLDGISLCVRAGEVLGLAGLEGNGQELLLRACAGLLPLARGEYTLAGQPLTNLDYHSGQRNSIRYLAAGRLEEGLVGGLSLTEHMALVDDEPEFMVNWPRHHKQTAERIRQFQVVGRPDSLVEELSGGNQQRFLLGLLPPSLKLILMEHPTRGLDLRSTDWIWQQLNERRKHGTAIIFISADLDEILERSDRIAVFSGGRMSRVVDARKISPSRLGHLIGGER